MTRASKKPKLSRAKKSSGRAAAKRRRKLPPWSDEMSVDPMTTAATLDIMVPPKAPSGRPTSTSGRYRRLSAPRAVDLKEVAALQAARDQKQAELEALDKDLEAKKAANRPPTHLSDDQLHVGKEVAAA